MDLIDLVTAKALQSKKDNRMSVISKIENEEVVLNMQNIGKRVFPVSLVLDGFILHMDYKSMIRGFLISQSIDNSIPTTDEKCYRITENIFDTLSNNFPDLTNLEIYQTVRSFMRN